MRKAKPRPKVHQGALAGVWWARGVCAERALGPRPRGDDATGEGLGHGGRPKPRRKHGPVAGYRGASAAGA